MNLNLCLFTIFVFLFSIICQSLWIKRLNKMEVHLVQKEYGPRTHLEKKSKTPVMGGVVFLFVVLVSIALMTILQLGSISDVLWIWMLPVVSSLIGLYDDWMKFSSKSSEGISSRKKLYFQIIVSLTWSIFFTYTHGVQIWPGFEMPSRLMSVTLLTFLTVGMLNSMNITDGLDGLASGSTVISLFAIFIARDMDPVITVPCLTGLAITTSFLWHNAHPAKVFMGDVGSHFLGAILVVLCSYGNFVLFLVPVAFIFGFEMLSVCIQLIAIYFFRSKVFLMSPIHHHFELSGWSENQIVMRFWLIHGIGILFSSFILFKIVSSLTG